MCWGREGPEGRGGKVSECGGGVCGGPGRSGLEFPRGSSLQSVSWRNKWCVCLARTGWGRRGEVRREEERRGEERKGEDMTGEERRGEERRGEERRRRREERS